jgi:cell division protein FtsB
MNETKPNPKRGEFEEMINEMHRNVNADRNYDDSTELWFWIEENSKEAENELLKDKIKNLERELHDINQNKAMVVRLAKEEERERIHKKAMAI